MQVKRPQELKRLKKRADDEHMEKATGAKQLQERLFGQTGMPAENAGGDRADLIWYRVLLI